MPRTEARLFTGIWKDPDWRPLHMAEQWLYEFLLSQHDLSYCGVIPLRPRRWARAACDVTEQQILDALRGLEEARFVVVDEDTEEVLVRSLMRRDKILRQPFLWPGTAEAIEEVESPHILAVILDELARCVREGAVNDKIIAEVRKTVLVLSRQVGDANTHPDTHADTHPDTHADSLFDTHPDTHPGPQQGGGGLYGENSRTSPPPPVPSAPAVPPPAEPPAAETAPPDPPEGDPRIDELVAEVRKIRPDWSGRSIRRALTRPAVLERPPEITRAAIVAVASDPDSIAPGRLEHDGPWWRPPTTTFRAPPVRQYCQVHAWETLPCRACRADRLAADVAEFARGS